METGTPRRFFVPCADSRLAYSFPHICRVTAWDRTYRPAMTPGGKNMDNVVRRRGKMRLLRRQGGNKSFIRLCVEQPAKASQQARQAHAPHAHPATAEELAPCQRKMFVIGLVMTHLLMTLKSRDQIK